MNSRSLDSGSLDSGSRRPRVSGRPSVSEQANVSGQANGNPLSLVGLDVGGRRSDDSGSARIVSQRPTRLRLIGLVALLWTGVLVVRMYSLQVSSFQTWQEWALRQHVTNIEVASERGAVLDRN